MSGEKRPALNRFNVDGRYSSRREPEVRPAQPSRPQTESAMERSLIVHYRRIVGQESQAVQALYRELEELRADPRVARFIEATRELGEAEERREQAARDLGMVICRELGEVKP